MVGKWGSLGEVSILGQNITLGELNLQELLGRESESFTICIQIIKIKNGYPVACTALVDTGANGFAFINTHFALLVARHFNLEMLRLKSPCALEDMMEKQRTPLRMFFQ